MLNSIKLIRLKSAKKQPACMSTEENNSGHNSSGNHRDSVIYICMCNACLGYLNGNQQLHRDKSTAEALSAEFKVCLSDI